MAPSSPPFGDLLRRYRAAAGLTQQQLAARAGLSVDAVSTLESGKRRSPHHATIQLLTEALALPDAEREALVVAARPPGTAAVPGAVASTRTPPLTLSAVTAPSTPLVGRTVELAAIRQRLLVGKVRLLTLTGPAGVGKTRLALTAAAQLAEQFADGVMLVDLAPIREPFLVLPAIARALGLTDSGSLPFMKRLLAYLHERAVLLVLDNFEQVLPAATGLADLLADCPRLSLLVTSRIPLQLRGKHTLRVPPLPVPDLTSALPPLHELEQVPAVALFVERAQAERADFVLNEALAPLVAQLVVQLDGLPLALELAAARLNVLSLPTIVWQLAERRQLLRWEAPDRPARHQSLDAAIGWSYDLLSARERRLFRSLGVFVGRVSLNAITAVVASVGGEDHESHAETEEHALEGLVSLAEKSLLLPGRSDEEALDDAEPAFGMLETVREFAHAQLRWHGELEVAQRAHAHYFLALAERAEPLLRTQGQRRWFVRLEHEHANLRAALRWLLDQDEPAEREAALRLGGALGWFWTIRGYHTEGVRWLEEALARAPKGEVDGGARTRALVKAGAILVTQGTFARGKALLEEALTLAQARHDVASSAEALTELGARAVFVGDVAEGVRLLQEALRRWENLADHHSLGLSLFLLGIAASRQGNAEEAASLHVAALERLEAVGDMRMAGTVHFTLAVIVRQLGDLARAVHEVRAGLEASASLHDHWLLGGGALVALWLGGSQGDSARRARLLGAADALNAAAGATHVWEHVAASPAVAALREQLEREGWGAEYREGRSLAFGEVATLARTLLEEFAHTLAQPVGTETAPEPAAR